MAVYTASGTKFYIGTTAAAANQAAFEADTFTEVKEVTNIGEFGDTAQQIEFSSIDDSRVRKLKGLRDAGTLELQVAHDPSDNGQNDLRDAAEVDLDYNFKIVLNDAPVGGDPTTIYFRGAVLSKPISVGDGKDVIKQSFNVSLNTKPLYIAASA